MRIVTNREVSVNIDLNEDEIGRLYFILIHVDTRCINKPDMSLLNTLIDALRRVEKK